MPMPASALFRSLYRPHQLRDNTSAGGVGDAEITVLEERTQSFRNPGCVTRLYMSKRIDDWLVEHVQGSLFLTRGRDVLLGSKRGRLTTGLLPGFSPRRRIGAQRSPSHVVLHNPAWHA